MGRLIDADKLRKEVLKWMPPDPCGQEEKEYPFETDIVASMMMTIDEAETVDAIKVEWIKSQIPKSEEFYATLISIILLQLINKYHEEQQGDTQ